MRNYKGLIVIILLVVTGCTSNPLLTEEASSSLDTIAKENRSPIEKAVQDPNFLYDFANSDDVELSNDVLQTLRIKNRPSQNVSSNLTKEQLTEDIEIFNQTLKYMYPMYQFFGGDQAFNKAKDEVISDIESHQEETMTKSRFVDMIREHYQFIVDTHFWIEHESIILSDYELYVTSLYSFTKDQNGEFWTTGEKAKKLLNINGDVNLESYLKPTINENGEIVYMLATFSESLSSNDREWEVVFQQDEEEQSEIISLKVESKELSKSRLGVPFSLEEKEGVPWLQIRSMFVGEASPYDYYDIINTAKKLKNEPYIVLDLRGNTGGNMHMVEMWLEEFFEVPPSWTSQYIYLISNTTHAFLQDTIDHMMENGLSEQNLEEEFFKEKAFIGKYDFPIEPTWEVIENEFHSVNDHDTHIFVLTDNNTASAAEHLTYKLRLTNQTTVIGMHTMGAIISGDALYWMLPNSKAELQVPAFFNYHPDLIKIEAVGIQPDLWVRPEVAEQRILAFIKNNTEQ
ncbi:S41 family peptidase [Bacillus sp. AK128]